MSQTQQATKSPKDLVIEAAGGAVPLAKALGITRGAVYQWTEIPYYQCKRIEELFGVPRKVQRPDIFS
jgi:hypothetical protein